MRGASGQECHGLVRSMCRRYLTLDSCMPGEALVVEVSGQPTPPTGPIRVCTRTGRYLRRSSAESSGPHW